ncbi:MAG: hypothetical protein R8M70_01305 [Alphaproteobacteria bacterium]|nr:hypothetical protein [Alphaproteobacteria bacterium]
MAQKSNLHYRWKDDNLIVKRNGGKNLIFPKALGAFHKKGEIMVISSLGKQIRIDKYGHRHWL